MANLCNTTYKVTGTEKAVKDLWNTLQSMNVNTKNIWLDELAVHYGIDYEGRGIKVRGHIYFGEFEEDDDYKLLTFETETAWTACNDLFDAINEALNAELSISYREIECGCGIYSVHDEGCFFPEECCISSAGEPFEECCEEALDTIEDAINLWCNLTGIELSDKRQEEKVDFINEYEYNDEDTYFNIHPFEFE